MAQTKRRAPALAELDSIQLTMPDIHTVPRGKVVAGQLKETLAKEGFDMWGGSAMFGPTGGMAPYLITSLSPHPSHDLKPCMETLTLWPWVGTEKRKVGHIICDMYKPDGSPDLNCPRQLLKAQLDDLWEKHGLTIKTAFEYEFFAFKENTLEPLGSTTDLQAFDSRIWGEHQELFSELRETLEAMDITIRMMHAEFAPGQWELTTIPYPGVTGADVCFHVKNAVKGFFKTQGYIATFMTRPTLSSVGSGLHLNHSLWRPLSADGKEENAFAGVEGGLSSTAKHWIAGLLAHAEALSALLSPSLNCYRRLHDLVTPSLITWGLEDRNASIRARVKGNNAFLENRQACAAVNPYLALAGIVAAGLDGLDQRLECPPPSDSKNARELPRSLDQALSALEKDVQLTARLGEDFVHCFVNTKRENEVTPFEKADLKTDEERIAFEKDLYFKVY